MVIEIIESRNRVIFEDNLREKIKGLENHYIISDIKYSTTYDSTNKMVVYSAIIICKEIK